MGSKLQMKPLLSLIGATLLIAGCGSYRNNMPLGMSPGFAAPMPEASYRPSHQLAQAGESGGSPTPKAPRPTPSPIKASAKPAPAASIAPRPAASGKPAQVKLFRSYGSNTTIHVRGRVMEPEKRDPVNADDSSLKNFVRNLENMTVDEIPGLKVDITLENKTVRLVSDHEGMLLVSTELFGKVTPGLHTLKAELVPGQGYWAPASESKIVIQDAEAQSMGIVSDIDDTIKVSDVTNKLSAVRRLLFKNEMSAEAIPGTSQLYQILEAKDGHSDGDIHYLSGSPLNLAEMIYGFLDGNQYPRGAVDLKKWGFDKGDDNPIQQQDYKQGKLRTLFKTYPGRNYLLFGDSGEKDPEIYLQIAKEFPGRVKGIFINNVTDGKPSDARFQGVHLTNSAAEAAAILEREGLLSAAEVAQVREAVASAGSH